MLINRFDQLQDLIEKGVIEVPETGPIRVDRVGRHLLVADAVDCHEWDTDSYGTEMMRWTMARYMEGRQLISNHNVAETQNGVLYLSCGRQKGHTTAMLDFCRENSLLDIAVVTPLRYGVARFPQNAKVVPHISAASRLRGSRYDVVFVDHCGFDPLESRFSELITDLRYISDSRVVVLCSDLNGPFLELPSRVKIIAY